MPDLANRAKHEKRLEAAILPIFQRWESEFEKSQSAFPVTITDDERAAIRQAMWEPFKQSANTLADQLEFEIDDAILFQASAFVTNFTGEFCDAIVDSTNRWIQRIEAEAMEQEDKQEKAIWMMLPMWWDKLKDTVLSAKRAATIGITEVTRMATAGERMIASAWERVFGKKRAEESKEPEEIVTRGPVPVGGDGGQIPKGVKLVRRWHTEADERVCPLCSPLHMLYEDQWPPDAKNGSPLHTRCRCWVEWEKQLIGGKP